MIFYGKTNNKPQTGETNIDSLPRFSLREIIVDDFAFNFSYLSKNSTLTFHGAFYFQQWCK